MDSCKLSVVLLTEVKPLFKLTSASGIGWLWLPANILSCLYTHLKDAGPAYGQSREGASPLCVPDTTLT